MRKKMKKLVVSLDIGTSKVVAIIASISMQNDIEIVELAGSLQGT